MTDIDLLIQNGSVYDASQGLSASSLDVAITGDQISEIAAGINPARAVSVINASGKIVCAGLVDAMAHNWTRNPMGVAPDTLALQDGVTISVSPGDAGAGSVGSFRQQVVNPSQARAFCEVMISRWGYDRWPSTEIYPDLSCINSDDVAWACVENWDIVTGIKIRLSEILLGSVNPQDIMDKAFAARTLAEAQSGKQFYIRTHIGALPSSSLLTSIVSQMRAGDIIAHCYDGMPNSLGQPTGFAQGFAPIAAGYTAKTKGIILDIGFGGHSCDWLTSAICAAPLNHSAPGIRPDVISSDTNLDSNGNRVHLLDVMSSLLALNQPSNINYSGFAGLPALSPAISLTEVINWATWAPAKAINRDALMGTLQVGARADVAVLTLSTGSYSWPDYSGRALTGTQRLAIHKTICNGNLVV